MGHPPIARNQAIETIRIGIDLAKAACAQGRNLLAVGEMGIGNTTASAAIASVMTGHAVAEVTGRGTGVDDERLTHKISVIEQALQNHRLSSSDALEVLTNVGGFEIGGMVGIILGAASSKAPLVLDGFIAGASALLAVALDPSCRDYLIASHVSQEPGHRFVLDHLQLQPVLDLQLRLGEGAGATFAEAKVDGAFPHDTESPVTP